MLSNYYSIYYWKKYPLLTKLQSMECMGQAIFLSYGLMRQPYWAKLQPNNKNSPTIESRKLPNLCWVNSEMTLKRVGLDIFLQKLPL